MMGEVRYLLALSGGLCVGQAFGRAQQGFDWAWLAVAGGACWAWWWFCVVWEARS